MATYSSAFIQRAGEGQIFGSRDWFVIETPDDAGPEDPAFVIAICPDQTFAEAIANALNGQE
jgi:hypothetical protein